MVLLPLLALFALPVPVGAGGAGGDNYHGKWFDYERVTQDLARDAVEELPYTRREDGREGATDKEIWVGSGSVAGYRMLRAIHRVTVPVPIQLIFVGFEQDGQYGLNLAEHDFEEWFSHIEHSLRHTIVPVGEEQTTSARVETRRSPVQYRFSYTLLKLHPLVNTVLEDVILWHLRPEVPFSPPNIQAPSSAHYVDAYKMSRTLEHLLLSLNLTNAYTLFILNPKQPLSAHDSAVYGYRIGFSDSEIQIIKQRRNEWVPLLSKKKSTQQQDGISEIQQEIQRIAQPMSGRDENSIPGTPAATSVNTPINNSKISVSDVAHSSEIWARWYIKNRGRGEVDKACEKAMQEGAREDSPLCISRSQRSERVDIITLVKDIAENGTLGQKQYLQRIRDDEYVHQDCLVDLWVGHSRFGFIDLTAGPFKWGPLVGGQGIRSLTSLPRVPANIEWTREQHLSQAAPLAAKIQEAIEGRRSQESLNQPSESQTEVELIKAYYAQHCSSDRNRYHDKYSFVNCNYLLTRLKQLDALPESQKNDLLFTGSDREGAGESLVADNFLSGLGATISMTLRHVFAPPAPLFPAYFTKRVTFHFFVLHMHQGNPMAHFDYEAYKHELLSFKLPSQEFSFVMKEINLREDRELMMAFTSSLRSAMLPNLKIDGEFTPSLVQYIDSKAVQLALKQLNLHEHEDQMLAESEPVKKTSKQHMGNNQRPTQADTRSGKGTFSRDIPVFFFSLLQQDVPLFIDKYYQAKALSDMVLMVQSANTSWESRLGCNGKAIHWDLRNPLRAGLAATLLHYGGLIPTHITYDEANRAAAQQWAWSVGDSPLVHTSHGSHFSSLHRDIVLRNFVVNVLEESIDRINNGIHTLLSYPTTEANHGADIPGMELTQAYRSIRKNWEKVASYVGELEFEEAIAVLKPIERAAITFTELTEKVAAVLTEIKCETVDARLGRLGHASMETGSQRGFMASSTPLVLCFAVSGLLMGVFLALRSRSHKVKTN